ncbi:methyl-accepting chemotaxis protein [Peteryoungia ipomoeae]|uniref:PAS domain S-box protein n=1 Tax=Peteryoungia ipomoeae TaxID=1210932 RepID=A0A4S8NY43_9HYPH|nr:PAS domain-containing methyl-accepting chemotaxis protein [Peteryoungia ipomoeae]THV22428.1 PAS domain S-box protein [Peteryoungia ipomoeae]
MRLNFLSGFDSNAILDALSRSQAIIEFTPDGIIQNANENFCRAVGYSLAEIRGKHHRIFCDPAYAASADYREFWSNLNRGQFDSREYRRLRKDGSEIWIQASYNPVYRGSKLTKIVKIAADITEAKRKATEDAGKLAAIGRVQAVIEFTPQGKILNANENFLAAVGYDLTEIVGRHHSIFCEPAYAQSAAYQGFWQTLAEGQFVTDEFKRIGKGGKEIWIQASYNPIVDHNGKVLKVIKFATDITDRIHAVDAIADGLEALADGDLTCEIGAAFTPAFERMRKDFNGTLCRLRQTIASVSNNTENIAGGAGEIMASCSDLAKRTEVQAASVEETAAALQQITRTVTDSSRRASEAGELVARTKAGAEKSGEVVRSAIDAMDQIENSSREISNIIGVIDDIAFQTNLLALNAGVEAARAGEAGKGFAVVAQEVRELAQRSANAAKEIKTLINASSDHVRNGVQLVGETGRALEQIVSEVQEINGNVIAIVGSAQEQATALSAIGASVTGMDANTQQNAIMVEQSTAASENLASQASALRNLVGQFRIEKRTFDKLAPARRVTPVATEPERKLVAGGARG